MLTTAFIDGESAIKQLSALSISWPAEFHLQVTPQQFEQLAQVNRELRLERSATGELIVNPPTGWETGKRNFSLIGQLYRWCTDNEEAGEASQ
jgi:Uma2 family endonuclease